MAMLPRYLTCCGRRRQTPSEHAFRTPALRKEREGRGTQGVGDGGEIKNLGHLPTRDNALTNCLHRHDKGVFVVR
jgi:hypothetical protein